MLYLFSNGPMQTTAAALPVTTGAVIKTMLQIKLLVPAKIVDWWISFDGMAPGTPIRVELIETDVAATVTAFAAADIAGLDAEALLVGSPLTSYVSAGVAASGYTATAEGTITAVRDLVVPQFIAPTNQNIIQFPLGRNPYLQPSKFQRIRVTAPAAVNCYCGFTLEF